MLAEAEALEEDGEGEAGGEEVFAAGAVGSDLIVAVVVVEEEDDILEMSRSVGINVEADRGEFAELFRWS